MIILAIVIFLFLCYATLVVYYYIQWKKIPTSTEKSDQPSIAFSVIIPARNEEKNIQRLLESIKMQNYPASLVEVIVVDDHSNDSTAAIARKFEGVKVLQLSDDNINSYKKKALETGIQSARNEWIITTDADCTVPEEWLLSMAKVIEGSNAVFIAAPVRIDCSSKILEVFQAMDFMVLQVITGAAVYHKKLSMCNGANIAYKRSVFNEVGGFSGIDDIASGDDMLLMYKIAKKYPHQINYLKSKDAIVDTLPMKTWNNFLNQRIRWASKAKKYDDKRIFPVLLLVYLFNCCFLLLIIAALFNFGGYKSEYWLSVAALWLLKTFVELPLFRAAAFFFDKTWAIRWFFFFQPLHVIYTIISGLFGQFGKYEWKGRKVK